MHFETLTLWCADLHAQHAFYTQTLGLTTVQRMPGHVTFQAGRTRLTFRHAGEVQGFYHLAFDIPRNQMDSAEAWLRVRTPVLHDPQGKARFPRSGRWTSESVYFEDPAGNILEFVARHDFPSDRAAAFSSTGLLHVSELGVVVPDVPATVRDLGQRFGLLPFNDCSDTFCAVGDHHGLLIVVREGRGWVPARRPATPAPFELTFSEADSRQVLRHSDLPVHAGAGKVHA
ncbi:VOC family protein [Deinococcus aerophilus]|uniref:VOC domain-containing protein n=1 Tax=Deinococcus aerophilus TaxID=522488 RepID=A0ABQ2GM55_9DEIO|nr:hypothetical protein [Deinococcus aerophilus]GGM03301.1 hypothetical protein GCM10010841_09680 [Deinococcus aerophilus]